MQKGKQDYWTTEFNTLRTNADFLLLQEALEAQVIPQTLEPAPYYLAFARGYSNKRFRSGIATLSRTPPVGQCHLRYKEPWIRTIKSTLITRYDIDDTTSDLLVANLHAVNFTFGTRLFRKQVAQLATVLRNHNGPILISGDLNTWRASRQKIVTDALHPLGLTPALPHPDFRKRFWGYPLDHLYVRGFSAVESKSTMSSGSDHNPIQAIMTL